MKRYIKSTESKSVPTLHIYVDIEAAIMPLAAASGIDFDNLEIFSKNKSIARRYKKSKNWLTPVTQMIRRILKSMDERGFNLISYKDSPQSYTYYIKFKPVDTEGNIINKELQLQIELRDHTSKTHTEGKINDKLYVKAYYIENTEYPNTAEVLIAVYQILDKLQKGDFSDFGVENIKLNDGGSENCGNN